MAKKANNQELEENKIIENQEAEEARKTEEARIQAEKKAEEKNKTDKIVEDEGIVVNKKDIISEKVKKNDVIDVQTSEDIIQNNSNEEEKLVDLKVKIPFTDKYDETKKYIQGDIIQVNEERAKELLEDKRNLVSLATK